jgi:hypothetical protein
MVAWASPEGSPSRCARSNARVRLTCCVILCLATLFTSLAGAGLKSTSAALVTPSPPPSVSGAGSPTNASLVYAGYLGGKDYESVTAVAVDEAGFLYVAGYTKSPDFPTMNAVQPTHGGETDAFAAKISPDGSRLVFSTYIGGSGDDYAYALALDSGGHLYVAGETQSTDFPMSKSGNSIQKSNNGDQDAFLIELDADGKSILCSTYLGGRDGETATGLALDAQGDIYLFGSTQSTDFPTRNPLQAEEAGPLNPESTQHLGVKGDLFVAKLQADGSRLIYSTYLGGSDIDRSGGIAVDGEGNAYIAGSTNSPDFPTANPLQAHPRSFQSMFVSKLNAEGTALIYSTYLGGGRGDHSGGSIAVDAEGNAYIGGSTSSNDFPTANAFQGTNRGLYNLFVSKLNPSGSELVFSTYLGGSYDVGGEIALDGQGNIYVAGETWSANFPVVNPAQTARRGQIDASLAKLDPSGAAIYYSTYLGGSEDDSANAVAVDARGNAYLAGHTDSRDLPAAGAFQPRFARAQDGFVARVASPSGIQPVGHLAYWWSGPLWALAGLVAVLIAALLFFAWRTKGRTPRLVSTPSLRAEREQEVPQAIYGGATDASLYRPASGTDRSGAIPDPPALTSGIAPPAPGSERLEERREPGSEAPTPRLPRWTLWVLWVAANGIGGACGAMASSTASQWVLNSSPVELGAMVLFTTFLPGGVIWLALGTAQWLVLKLYLPNVAVALLLWWLLASFLAGVAAIYVGMLVLFPLMMLSVVAPLG